MNEDYAAKIPIHQYGEVRRKTNTNYTVQNEMTHSIAGFTGILLSSTRISPVSCCLGVLVGCCMVSLSFFVLFVTSW